MRTAAFLGSVLCLAAIAAAAGASPPALRAEPTSGSPPSRPHWIGTADPAFPGPTPAPTIGVGSGRIDCGAFTLTQSTDTTVITNSVYCGSATVSAATSLARAFVAPYDMSLECVTFGVRINSGNAWPVNVRILIGPVGSDYSSLILVSETQVVIPEGAAAQFFTAQLAGTVLAAGTEFVVELQTPSRDPIDGGDGGRIELGCNNRGQSDPTYFRGPTCGIDNFQTAASVGFANRHLVMTLGVDDTLRPPNDSPFDAPLIDLGVPVAFSTEGALADGPTGICVGGRDVFYKVQAGPDPLLSVELFAHEDADAAVACYDLGPTGDASLDDLTLLLAGCVDSDLQGDEFATFDVTPGHFYLIQIGSGGGGAGSINGLMFAYAGALGLGPNIDACIPGPCDTTGKVSVCKNMPFGEYAVLTALGARLSTTCTDCDTPNTPCPCVNDTRNLAAYWPMNSIIAGWPSYTSEDFIGAADLVVPNFAGNHTNTIAGPKGNAISITASTVLQGSRGGLIPSTLNPIPHHGASSFTFATWVSVPSWGGIIYSNGWKISVDATGAVHFDGVVQCSGLPPIHVSASSDEVTVPPSPTLTITPGQWAHVVVKVDRGSIVDPVITFWINGVQKRVPQAPSAWPCAVMTGPEPAELGDDGMWLDEVMLFDRAISDARAGSLMGNSLAGMCTYTAYVTPYLGCIGTASIDVTICEVNPTGFGGFYVLGTPGGGSPPQYYGQWTPCTSNQFELSPYIMVVPWGGCATQTYSIGVPPACATGFTFSVAGSGSGPTAISGAVRCETLTMSGGLTGTSTFYTGSPELMTLTVGNISSGSVSYPYQLFVTDTSGALDTSMFSLNDLGAGSVLTGTISLAPGASMDLDVLIEALSVDALGFYNLTLSVDESGTGTYLPVGAIGLRALLPPGITLCPSDYTGDTTVDILDFLDFFDDFGACFGQPAPCGTLGNSDVNGDTLVDILDFLDFLDAFGSGC